MIATSPDGAGGPVCTTPCDSYLAPAEERDLPFQDWLEALSVRHASWVPTQQCHDSWILRYGRPPARAFFERLHYKLWRTTYGQLVDWELFISER